MYEVKNRIHFDGSGKVVAFDDPNAVTSIPPGRISDAEAAARGLTAAVVPVAAPEAPVAADVTDAPVAAPKTRKRG